MIEDAGDTAGTFYIGSNPSDTHVLCDGKEYSTTTYPKLFSSIGYKNGIHFSTSYFSANSQNESLYIPNAILSININGGRIYIGSAAQGSVNVSGSYLGASTISISDYVYLTGCNYNGYAAIMSRDMLRIMSINCSIVTTYTLPSTYGSDPTSVGLIVKNGILYGCWVSNSHIILTRSTSPSNSPQVYGFTRASVNYYGFAFGDYFYLYIDNSWFAIRYDSTSQDQLLSVSLDPILTKYITSNRNYKVAVNNDGTKMALYGNDQYVYFISPSSTGPTLSIKKVKIYFPLYNMTFSSSTSFPDTSYLELSFISLSNLLLITASISGLMQQGIYMCGCVVSENDEAGYLFINLEHEYSADTTTSIGTGIVIDTNQNVGVTGLRMYGGTHNSGSSANPNYTYYRWACMGVLTNFKVPRLCPHNELEGFTYIKTT